MTPRSLQSILLALLIRILLVFAVAVAGIPALADDEMSGDEKAEEKAAPESGLRETESRTRHTITLGGQELRYTATAGTLLLKDDKEKVQGLVFSIA